MLAFDMNSTYYTRNGYSVRLVCTDRRHSRLPLVGLVFYPEHGLEFMKCWTADGKASADDSSEFDLIGEHAFSTLKIGAKVLYKTCQKGEWIPAHFAGISPDCQPMVFEAGRSNWTADKKTAVFAIIIPLSTLNND